MDEQIFRDGRHREIGRIVQRPNGMQEARDRFHRSLGTYQPRSNQTRDREHHLVGHGNLLPSLISRSL